MRPRLLVEPEAGAELDEAFTWYEGRAAGLGSEVLRAVRASFALIRRILSSAPVSEGTFGGRSSAGSPMRSTTWLSRRPWPSSPFFTRVSIRAAGSRAAEA
jgi:hypothetical protein